MASFSDAYPSAVHVFPIHALLSILNDGALLAKENLTNSAHATIRPSTSQTDLALGLRSHVHFYLRSPRHEWTDFPLLAAQLLGQGKAPFPHLALEIPTSILQDSECTLCLWNCAVSRPKVDGHCLGGNWTRGTDASRIVEVWQRFRQSNPDARRARGYWNPPVELPTLQGNQINSSLALLRRAPRGMPELLLKARVKITSPPRLWAFSPEDTDLVRRVATNALPVHTVPLLGYSSGLDATVQVRTRIAAYFSGEQAYPQDLEFDRIR